MKKCVYHIHINIYRHNTFLITITVKLVILTLLSLALRSFVEYIIKYKPGEQLILVLSHDPLLIGST